MDFRRSVGVARICSKRYTTNERGTRQVVWVVEKSTNFTSKSAYKQVVVGGVGWGGEGN